MQTPLLKLLTVTLLLIANGCATSRVTVIDRASDWVKLGPDVRGHVSIYDAKSKTWVLQSKPVTLPEGWVAGPEPK